MPLNKKKKKQQIYLFICTQLNGFKYFYIGTINQFRDTVKDVQVLLFNTSNSSQHYSFACTQLNGSKYWYVSLTIQLNIRFLFTLLKDKPVLFLIIQFSICHLFAHSLNVKQFYLTHR